MTTMPQFPWLDRFYVIRVVMVLMILVVMAVQMAVCLNPPDYHFGLFFFGAAYPHLLQFTLGRFQGNHLRIRATLLADGFFAGAVMPVIAYGMAPCAILVAINLFNWMALGGFFLTLFGVLAILAGIGISGAFIGFEAPALGCAAGDLMSYGVLTAYFLMVGAVVFRYSNALRRHCDELQGQKDAAEMSGRRAERALMAVLPPSAASERALGGNLSPRSLANATLLFADFSVSEQGAQAIALLEKAWGACDEILFRHGLEGVKTFGQSYLAWAPQSAAGPENALIAALEIVSFFRDHGNDSGNHCDVRVTIHCGSVVAGVVQAEKFNYDVFGVGVDELMALARSERPSAILISAAARSHLQRDWRLAQVPGDWAQPVFTPVEHGGV